MRNGDYEGEGQPQPIEFRVALGVIHDAPDEPRRVRLLDQAGEEMARLSGVLAWKEAKNWVRFTADGGGGLSVSLTIPMDLDTRCTISPDGTMAFNLPNGATWITTPLVEIEKDERG